jgi:predicted anti-sigma-YlaC factor YlaD
MDCATAREELSALLDCEPARVERQALDAHLADCPGCRRWRERAHELTRRSRLARARGLPTPSEQLMAAAHAAVPRRGQPGAVTLTRIALAAIALAQMAVTVPALLFGSDHDSPIHVAHEMGSFDMALAVGFFAAALRPARARGMSVVVGAAALALMATALIDLAAARTTPVDEAPHLLAVAGWLLLRRLTALTPSSDHHAIALPTGATERSLLWRASRRASPQKGAGHQVLSRTAEEVATRTRIATSTTAPFVAEGAYDQPDDRALAG